MPRLRFKEASEGWDEPTRTFDEVPAAVLLILYKLEVIAEKSNWFQNVGFGDCVISMDVRNHR